MPGEYSTCQLSGSELLRGVDQGRRHAASAAGFAPPRSWHRGIIWKQGARRSASLKADMVEGELARGGPCDRPVETEPKFAVGDRVRTKNFNPTATRVCRVMPGRKRVSWRRSRRLRFPG